MHKFTEGDEVKVVSIDNTGIGSYLSELLNGAHGVVTETDYEDVYSHLTLFVEFVVEIGNSIKEYGFWMAPNNLELVVD